MSNNMRWRYGDTNPVVVPVDADTVIEIGDLVYLQSDDARPAGHDTNSDGTGDLWNTDLATTQEAFHDLFLGVAMQSSASGDSTAVRIATSGVFEFDSASATYELGDLIAMNKDTGDNLKNQEVLAVSAGNENLAVGRIAKQQPSATTSVLVDISSTIMSGGAQSAA